MPGPRGGSHGTQFAFGFERLEPQMDDILMTGKSLTHKRKMSKQIIFFILNVVDKKVLQLIVCLHLTLISASSPALLSVTVSCLNQTSLCFLALFFHTG